jgi:hypothetical protein
MHLLTDEATTMMMKVTKKHTGWAYYTTGGATASYTGIPIDFTTGRRRCVEWTIRSDCPSTPWDHGYVTSSSNIVTAEVEWTDDTWASTSDSSVTTVKWAVWPSTTCVRYPDTNPEKRLREIIKGRMAPQGITGRGLQRAKDVREERARETLRRVVGLENFQNYVKKGFLMITGKSGLRYQIFPGHGVTKVYQGHQLVERLCVVLVGDFPPTDSLIMRYLLILNDENKFRGYAVKHQVVAGAGTKRPEIRPGPPPPPLTEWWKNNTSHKVRPMKEVVCQV